MPPLMLAVARRAIEEVSNLAQGKIPVASSTALRGRASAQSKLAQAEAAVRSARLFLFDTLGEAWAAAVSWRDDIAKAKGRRAAGYDKRDD